MKNKLLKIIEKIVLSDFFVRAFVYVCALLFTILLSIKI